MQAIAEPKIIATEQGHWYTKDGVPCYEVENKSKPGEMRPTTLRDARKLDLVPSVTSVLSILAKPGLNAWKENQILLSAATAPWDRNTMSANEWAYKVLTDAQAQAEQAREKGTAIHGSIEKYILGEQVSAEFQPFVEPVFKELYRSGILNTLKAEHSFAHSLGFGGKVDCHTGEVIIDFKCKDYTQKDLDDKKCMAWDEHLYQLSAYRIGLMLPKAKCQNWFISTTEPGLIHIHEWTESELNKGEMIFMRTLDLWKACKL